MATFSLTKNPLNRSWASIPTPPYYTLPGALKAAQIAMEQQKLHRKSQMKTKAPTARSHTTDTNFSRKMAINPIEIVDIDMRPTSFKSHGKSFSKITLPTVPADLTIDPKPNWATIASIGRNNPFYHYTGSEDTLSFRIDWYSKMENRQDVIFYCKWLAARSKANGYYEDPHRILIVWGREDLLFKDELWIITKASYKLSQFQKQASMLPNQAYQDIELKKVTELNTDYDTLLGDIFPTQDNVTLM